MSISRITNIFDTLKYIRRNAYWSWLNEKNYYLSGAFGISSLRNILARHLLFRSSRIFREIYYIKVARNCKTLAVHTCVHHREVLFFFATFIIAYIFLASCSETSQMAVIIDLHLLETLNVFYLLQTENYILRSAIDSYEYLVLFYVSDILSYKKKILFD